MERNPYAAPNAPVADAVAPPVVGRPPAVRWAVQLLLLGVAINALGALIGPRVPLGLVVQLVLVALASAFSLWIITKISAGRNWARMTFAILTVIGYLSILFNWPVYAPLYEGNALYATAGVLCAVLNLCALYLVFTKPANAWFRRGVQPASSTPT